MKKHLLAVLSFASVFASAARTIFCRVSSSTLPELFKALETVLGAVPHIWASSRMVVFS